MSQFTLIRHWSLQREALSLSEVLNYLLSYLVFFDDILGEANLGLQALLQVLLGGEALQVLVEVSHYPEKMREERPQLLLLPFLFLGCALPYADVVRQVRDERELLESVLSDGSHHNRSSPRQWKKQAACHLSCLIKSQLNIPEYTRRSL